jgi:hypothetical protein
MPTMKRGGAGPMFHPTIFFTVIGFSYFLSSDVSFSLGASPFAYSLVSGLLLTHGVSLGGGFMEPTPKAFMNAGAFAGILVTIFFAGRHYYLSLLKRSLWIDRSDTHTLETHGLRMFFLCNVLLFFLLVTVGIDWFLAILYLSIISGIFLVVSRIIAETGSFQLHTYFFPCMLIWGFLGERAIGAIYYFVTGEPPPRFSIMIGN